MHIKISNSRAWAQSQPTLIAIIAGLMLVSGWVANANAQIASALVRENEALPGDMLGTMVTGISNSATNASGGYAFTITTDGSFSNVWGNLTGGGGTVLRSEGLNGTLNVTGIESFFGISDTGQISYGTTTTDTNSGVTGLDGVWQDNLLLLNEDDPVPTIADHFSVFNSRPGITANGIPYWVGGITSTAGGGTDERVLFMGTGATPVLRGGDSVGLISEATVMQAVDFDVRFSGLGSNYIVPVIVDSGSTANDVVVISNGVALLSNGILIRESNPIPAASGGIGDNFSNFDFVGITETGSFMITGDSDAAATTDEFVMIDGQIVLREGDALGAMTVNGSIDTAFMNEDGDWAAVWDVDFGPANLETLIVNGQVVLLEGDAVDWNGDGVIDGADGGATLSDFTGISAMTMSRRDAMGNVRIYFPADADVAGTDTAAAFQLTLSVAKIIKGDLNGDGIVSLLDVAPFVDALTQGVFVAEADINMDGVVSLLDVSPFVALLTGN